jgi:hypothetical protein
VKVKDEELSGITGDYYAMWSNKKQFLIRVCSRLGV